MSRIAISEHERAEHAIIDFSEAMDEIEATFDAADMQGQTTSLRYGHGEVLDSLKRVYLH